jgi:DNA-binding beta-propeller fold protein YncE
MGVAIDSAGNVLVADTANSRVLKFDSKGKLLKKMDSFGERGEGFGSPAGLATDRAGNLFVADSGSKIIGSEKILKFDSSWRFVAKWEYSGDPGPELEYPQGIAVDSKGAVFVADWGKVCIFKFDNSLNFLQKSSHSFSYPSDVKLDGEGNLLVLDAEDCKVKKFDAKLGFIAEWGSPGSGDGEFKGPVGIAVDSEGSVYVADAESHRIQKNGAARVPATGNST